MVNHALLDDLIMAKKILVISDYSGGISPNEKLFQKNSALFIKRLEIHEDPSHLVQSRLPAKVSGTTVTGLPHWCSDGTPWDTNRYFYDEDGEIYRETSGGTWSNIRSVSNSSGNGMHVFDGGLWYASDENVGVYANLDQPSTLAFNDTIFEDDVYNISQIGGGTTNTYTTPVTPISETDTNKLTFTNQHDPIMKMVLNIVSKGSGDWTITVHDTKNTVLHQQTWTNASLSTGDYTFTFTNPIRLSVGKEYHIHVTSTVADGTINTLTASDLSDAKFELYFKPLIDTQWHPMVDHQSQLLIGNGNHIAVWDKEVYEPNLIVLDSGFEARTMCIVNEYVIVGCTKGDGVYQSEMGRLYFWDGIEEAYNFYQDVPAGLVNAIVNLDNGLLGVYGERGEIYAGADQLIKLYKQIPSLARDKKVEVYPGAITNWRQMALIGYAGSTDDGTSLIQGVYTYGKPEQKQKNSLVYSYTVSTGTESDTNLRIGMVKGIGDDCYIGWDDDGTFGVDKVSLSSSRATSGSYESLIFDGGASDVILPLELVIEFEPLLTNQTITPKYKLDRATSWTTGNTATVGATRAELPIFTRCDEIQVGFDLAAPDEDVVTIIHIKLRHDDLSEEQGN